MAGYSKGIVDTRKLNKNNKAKLGRRGDTKIREVDGRDSHVSAFEAYLIDVNGKAGEEYAKRGAGTINPLTGMPEYHAPKTMTFTGGNLGYKTAHDDTTHSHPQTVGRGSRYDAAHDWSEGGQTYTPEQEINWDAQNSDLFEGGNMPDYDYLSTQDDAGLATTLTAFDKDLGIEDVKYFQDIFTDKPFDFLKEQQDLTTRGLKSAYSDTMGALGSQEAALGRSVGHGFTQATKGAEQATRKSNMAFSGTVTEAYETQKKDLFQDYTAGMGDIGRQRGTALETLTLGKDTAALDLEKGTYTEEQRQMDEYWDMIGMRQSV